MTQIARSAGKDWYVLDWKDVWADKRLSPTAVPGVQELPNSRQSPWPFKVHRTHLELFGAEVPGYRSEVSSHPILRPHQMAGLRYLSSRRGTLLADEQRVGKTPQIMYAHDPDAGALVIVGPLAARASWHEWTSRRFGACVETLRGSCSICDRVGARDPSASSSFIALDGRKLTTERLLAARQARVIFLHFAIVPSWRQLFNEVKIGTLAVDEAHLAGVQNRKSVTVESIRWLNTVADRCVFATGTPLYNRPRGLWPILDIVTPGAFGDFWSFARRYCDAKPTAYGWQAQGSSNEAELQLRLREVMLRRTWRDIAPTLPPVTRSVEIVALSDDRRNRIEEVAARIRSKTSSVKTAVGDLARLRKLYAKEKCEAGVAHIARNLIDGNSTVAWTWHRDVADSIAELLRKHDPVASVYGPIHGDTHPTERERIIDEARSASESRPTVLIATMASLATAVNLSFCSHEVFVELDWNPSNIAQAEMRPFDGSRSVACTYLVADCETDQRLADALLSKFEVIDSLGLRAGAGSVETVLSASIGVCDEQTLSALADAVIREAS